jgi:deuterolysin
MYLLPAILLGLAGTAFASPARRASGISVDVAGPSSAVTSLNDLKITAKITNSGSETVRFLKYGTILDEKLPTKSFKVTKDGEAVPFTGIKLSVDLNEVDDSAFATIPAGQTVTVEHDVASLYDFAAVGAGTYTFEPVTTFQMQGVEESVAAHKASFAKVTTSTNKVEVQIAGDLAKRELTLDKRARDICTDSSKKSFIDSSYTEGKALASGAVSYISSHGSDTLYKAYFGATATSRVSSVLSAVANENSSSRTLSCTDTYGACSSGVIAYTVIATTNVYFCSIFFNEKANSALCSGTTVASRNIRGGTTLHELTHATSGTDDVTYGCSADQALSDSQSVINADNYNCFTTQVYANTKC